MKAFLVCMTSHVREGLLFRIMSFANLIERIAIELEFERSQRS